MGKKIKPCEFCKHDFPDYPFGGYCIIHHDHCETTYPEGMVLTQNTSTMIHQAWHRLEACVKRLKEDEKDGKLWLLSWQLAGSVRTLDYLPKSRTTMGKKFKSLYHRVFRAGATNTARKVERRKNQEIQKLLESMEIVKILQVPSTHIPGTKVQREERKKGL